MVVLSFFLCVLLLLPLSVCRARRPASVLWSHSTTREVSFNPHSKSISSINYQSILCQCFSLYIYCLSYIYHPSGVIIIQCRVRPERLYFLMSHIFFCSFCPPHLLFFSYNTYRYILYDSAFFYWHMPHTVVIRSPRSPVLLYMFFIFSHPWFLLFPQCRIVSFTVCVYTLLFDGFSFCLVYGGVWIRGLWHGCSRRE